MTDRHVETYGRYFVGVPEFLAGKSSLDELQIAELGDIRSKKVLHLMCHFGLDTLSLARMGAEVTGIDFSERSIEQANRIASQVGLEADFVCCSVYELPTHFVEAFDLVYTSQGVLNWLSDLKGWGGLSLIV